MSVFTKGSNKDLKHQWYHYITYIQACVNSLARQDVREPRQRVLIPRPQVNANQGEVYAKYSCIKGAMRRQLR